MTIVQLSEMDLAMVSGGLTKEQLAAFYELEEANTWPTCTRYSDGSPHFPQNPNCSPPKAPPPPKGGKKK